RRAGCEAEPVDQRGRETGTHDLSDQCRRGVVTAAGTALGRIHYAFEHAPQHVRCDGVAPLRFARREVESLEQLVERVAPVGVAPPGRAMTPFEGAGLE